MTDNVTYFVNILHADAWSGNSSEVTKQDHADACDRMEAFLDEHEEDDVSIRVRPSRHGEVDGLFVIDDYGRRWPASTEEQANLHDLLNMAWEHACKTWPR